MYGKNPSLEHRRRISDSLTGIERSNETKKKMSIAKSNRVISEETKSKFRGKNNPMYGKKPWNKGIPMREESKDILREKRKNWSIPFRNSLPERKIQSILSVNGIGYETHKSIKIGKSYHQVDVFIKPDICIEVDGCYFHGCKKHYRGKVEFYNKQVNRDKMVNKELEKQGYKLLRLWEHDINTNLMKCFKRIMGDIS